MAEQPLNTYRGNCHCGMFVYEVDLPGISSVSECNCSLCSKRGYLWVYPSSPGQFRVVKGDEDALTSYAFSSTHYKFCPHCGTGVLSRTPTAPPHLAIGINAHAIQELDTWSVERQPYVLELFDGAAMGSNYEHPRYTGSLPAEEIGGSRIHSGSCHCGRVQVALSSKPIDETFPEPVVECKCSICERNAYIWVSPLGVHVILHGNGEDIGRYLCSRRVMAKTFCKTCGVPLTNMPVELPEEERQALSDEDQKGYAMIKLMHPVNVRVLEGIDLKKLKIMRLTAGLDLQPVYVNP
ncbi:glutathione-dependent formaldehyde-activating enzyme [Microdochium trichocladiopsis]|uniref:Glutathione-dependent formaldehyde-activating enzyme n=1 Tax=Microdochium trichocladiopsis TaxID=1682393 RepID=A0A9P9BP63_9PEZI|nr:glutathione-dependent formaldehyde-activating enzyme [Microdochium trichocladiopsis]KAH7021568.1 glutathione-dependent formaldehyde-activating enzyme [Microdochium trichocladiopsis]